MGTDVWSFTRQVEERDSMKNLPHLTLRLNVVGCKHRSDTFIHLKPHGMLLKMGAVVT